MHEEQLCGESARTGGDGTSGLSIIGLLGAVAGVWALRFVVVALVGIAGGCAHTDIKRGPDDCGTFASSDHGFGLVVPTAGQYATYAQACGTERFSRVVANQRMAVAAGAYEATKRDAVALQEIARTQRAIGLREDDPIPQIRRDIDGLAADVVTLGDAINGAEGGAR